jgi:sugar lactone lactonase YvrE
MRIDQSRPSGAIRPLRLAVSRDGRVYVLDSAPQRVIVLSSGAPPEIIGGGLGKPGGFEDASDLAVDPQGRLFVLDAKGAIQIFAADGRPERAIDLRPLGVYNPRGLAISAEGELFIADTGGGRVLRCDATGKLLQELGRPGHDAGELVEPMSVAQDGSGRVVVVDSGNGRIQRFDPAGKVDGIWNRRGSDVGLLSPRLSTDGSGDVWVAGGDSDEIWQIAAKGAAFKRYEGPAGIRVVGFAVRAPRLFYLLERERGTVLQSTIAVAISN